MNVAIRRAAGIFMLAIPFFLASSLSATAAQPAQGPPGWEAMYKFAWGGVADKGATTVLFIHGLSSSARTFRNPTTAANMARVDFDPKLPLSVGGTLDLVYSGKAPRNVNYFSTFGQHFKVATWSQMPCHDSDNPPDAACNAADVFEAAYRSAPWALRKVLDETTGPIAIVGHSRGGLVGRRLLKEFGDAGGRIKWFVTLHTPHKGSGLSARTAAMNDITANIIKLLPKEAADIVNSARDGVIGMVGNQGGEELGMVGSMSIFPALMKDEKPIPTIKYMSFGGNSTTVLKLFVRAPLIGTDCPANTEYDAGLCYPKCATGYKGVGPLCWQPCPAGFTDHGVGCTKPAPYGRGAGYPWKGGDGLSDNGMFARCRAANPAGCEKDGLIVYPVCRPGYHKVGCCICSPTCPSGMTDTGIACTKKTASRGTPKSPSRTFDLFTSPTVSELINGQGDLLVTDANSRFPWQAPHVTQALHHGEVLWHTPTMQQVITFLKTTR
ncbi:esterase/lipase family protein [Usitatibacter palustris]|uniref:Uncharacterized protein n=1 Tax=Usitatibacter palustris TaxID=2732487 RepID=A0A6M4HBG5_9PROT|nr:hypothetical protein [Usitatibacter palustris]QJR16582.1 hypothetical protein DSM104440_03417 [Usitatibacter palustris]